jgi:UDP-N-acetylglucosamine acyltransferase
MPDRLIHPTAIVDPGAEIASDVTIGPHSIVESNVIIDAGCEIASNTFIASGTRLGKGIKVHHGAVIGSIPQDLKFGGEETTAEIGDNSVIREYCTINRGTSDKWKTTIGSNCLLMAYAHVAHDCTLGNHVIMANSVNLAGHVTIEEWAIIGGVVPVHQFVRIGKHSMIGGGFRVPMDICPYSLMGGYPMRVISVNHVGLSRRGFDEETIKTLKRAFKILFHSKLNTSQAFRRMDEEIEMTPEILDIREFFDSSERGVMR